ncbi:hypothetical protein, partial [Alcanivorax sp. MD8A]|uniref:hypothetical protein n=1 Tax=Alcanivorax sp. MD8A TaxID=1177157 RepID=UPI001E4B4FC7
HARSYPEAPKGRQYNKTRFSCISLAMAALLPLTHNGSGSNHVMSGQRRSIFQNIISLLWA